MGFLPVLLFALLCIFFLVTIVLSAWRWRWLNIVVMVFLFPAAATFMILFANLMEVNYKDRGALDKATKDLNKALEEQQVLLQGAKEATEWTGDSIKGLTHQLARSEAGRGRVWRDCIPGPLNGDKIEVTTFVAGPANADGTAQRVLPNNIKNDTVLFVFSQSPANEDGWSLPEKYLGEFVVESATDTTVTLAKVLVLDDAELTASAGRAWTLYELMPADMHYAFEMGETRELTTERPDMPIDQKREMLTTKYLTPESLGMDADSPEYKATIARYLLDGMSLGDIHEIEEYRTFDPPDDEEWILVEIIKDLEGDAIEEQVDLNIEIGKLIQSGSFKNYDNKGLALNPDLKNGSPVEIKKGDRLLLDRKTALDGYLDANGVAFESFISRGLAKQIGTVYVRSLNDYSASYREATLKIDLLNTEIQLQKVHNDRQEEAIALTAAEIAHRTKVRDGLEADNANLKRDLATLDKAFDAQNARFVKISTRIKELDQIIADSTAKHARAEAQWAKEADEKTRAAAGDIRNTSR